MRGDETPDRPTGPAVRVDGGTGGPDERRDGVAGGEWRLDSGDPTDLQVLRAVGQGGDRPTCVCDLAERLGLTPARVPVRLGTLVSLGYVTVLMVGKGTDDGYTLTELGAAELIRRRAEQRPG